MPWSHYICFSIVLEWNFVRHGTLDWNPVGLPFYWFTLWLIPLLTPVLHVTVDVPHFWYQCYFFIGISFYSIRRIRKELESSISILTPSPRNSHYSMIPNKEEIAFSVRDGCSSTCVINMHIYKHFKTIAWVFTYTGQLFINISCEWRLPVVNVFFVFCYLNQELAVTIR